VYTAHQAIYTEPLQRAPSLPTQPLKIKRRKIRVKFLFGAADGGVYFVEVFVQVVNLAVY
jgi:hypothetical protein